MGKKWESSAAVWARYMILTASIFSLDGGLFAFAFPSETLMMFPALVLPKAFFAPFSIPGVVGCAASVLMPMIEFHTQTPAFVKVFMCLALVPVLVMQLSLVPASSFWFFAAVGQLCAAFSKEPPKSLGK
ncbi:hypothetical protein DFJ77DRAFT_548883 [Powellomyces hirtus]|nr:hypothetical protein DFJ77DRAFT_548883 [Powellomyces hirtus]